MPFYLFEKTACFREKTAQITKCQHSKALILSDLAWLSFYKIVKNSTHTPIAHALVPQPLYPCSFSKKRRARAERKGERLSLYNSRMDEQIKAQKVSGQGATPFAQTYFHGTKADLKVGDLIEVGHNSNYGQQKNAKFIFLTATLDAAIWGAELALGDGRERIYLVEPTGEIEDDPDLTDKKFPGNPTQSYRSTAPFRVVGEVSVWKGHSSEQVKAIKEHLEKLKEQGINSLNE